MSLQEIFDELDNIVRTLDVLIDEITDKYYIDVLQDTKWEAENELEEVARKLDQEDKQEEREQEREYWNDQF